MSLLDETDADLAFWSMTDPEIAAEAAISLYGASAATAAAWCAVIARCDGRTADYDFWRAVFTKLREELP